MHKIIHNTLVQSENKAIQSEKKDFHWNPFFNLVVPMLTTLSIYHLREHILTYQNRYIMCLKNFYSKSTICAFFPNGFDSFIIDFPWLNIWHTTINEDMSYSKVFQQHLESWWVKNKVVSYKMFSICNKRHFS